MPDGGLTAALITGGATLGAGLLDAKSRRDVSKRAMEQRQKSLDFIEKQINRSRGDAFKLFPSAQQSRQSGIQAGLDLYRQAIPVQLQTFRQGNVGAQNQLIQGMPQFQNAILGRPVDNSQFQPTMIQGLSGLKMPNSPQFEGIDQLMKPTNQYANGLTLPRIQNINDLGLG